MATLSEALVSVLALGVLPAAGADSAPLAVNVYGREYLTLKVKYTRGAAGGSVTLRIRWKTKPDAFLGDEGSGTVLNGTVTLNQQDILLPPPTGAGAVTYYVPLSVLRGADSFSGVVFESGVPATPGTCGVTAVVSRDA